MMRFVAGNGCGAEEGRDNKQRVLRQWAGRYGSQYGTIWYFGGLTKFVWDLGHVGSIVNGDAREFL